MCKLIDGVAKSIFGFAFVLSDLHSSNIYIKGSAGILILFHTFCFYSLDCQLLPKVNNKMIRKEEGTKVELEKDREKNREIKLNKFVS